jgi:hypothetical protein
MLRGRVLPAHRHLAGAVPLWRLLLSLLLLLLRLLWRRGSVRFEPKL